MIEECSIESSFLDLVRNLTCASSDSTEKLYGSSKQAEVFEAFICNGQNVHVMQKGPQFAAEKILEFCKKKKKQTVKILDLGIGGGMFMTPIANMLLGHSIKLEIVGVDQSAEMLAKISVGELENVARIECVHKGFLDYVQEEMENATDEEDQFKFDVCLSSFALHYLEQGERSKVLQWVRERSRLFLLFEFDVDDGVLNLPKNDERRFVC